MYLKNVLFVVAVLAPVAFAKLPPSIKPCSRYDPNLDDCIIKAVNSIKPLLAHGDLGDGYRTPALEPLQLDNIEIGRGKQFFATFSDIEARGGSNFIIDKLKANASETAFDISLTLPRIDFVGKYLMKINILVLEIQGKGNMKGTVENAKAFVKVRGTRYLRDGVEYIKFTKMPIRISVNKIKLHLDNLFNGDKTLGEVGNTIINDNQELYLREMLPGLEKSLSEKFLDVANMVMDSVTFDEMFPEY